MITKLACPICNESKGLVLNDRVYLRPILQPDGTIAVEPIDYYGWSDNDDVECTSCGHAGYGAEFITRAVAPAAAVPPGGA